MYITYKLQRAGIVLYYTLKPSRHYVNSYTNTKNWVQRNTVYILNTHTYVNITTDLSLTSGQHTIIVPHVRITGGLKK